MPGADPIFEAPCLAFDICVFEVVVASMFVVGNFCVSVYQFGTGVYDDVREVQSAMARHDAKAVEKNRAGKVQEAMDLKLKADRLHAEYEALKKLRSIKYILHRASLVACLLMLGWPLHLFGIYDWWQVLIQFMLTNATCVLVGCGCAVWYKFFMLVAHIRDVWKITFKLRLLFWFPVAYLFVTANLQLFLVTVIDRVWPTANWYISLFVIFSIWLVCCWAYTLRLQQANREGGVSKRWRQSVSKETQTEWHGTIATMHWTILWATIVGVTTIITLFDNGLGLAALNNEARFYTHYIDTHWSKLVYMWMQGLALTLSTYAGLKERRQPY